MQMECNKITLILTIHLFLGLPFQMKISLKKALANQITFAYWSKLSIINFCLVVSLGSESLNFNSFKVYNEELLDDPYKFPLFEKSNNLMEAVLNLNLGLLFKPN